MHTLEAGLSAAHSEAGVACLSVKPSQCFQTSCACGLAARRKALHHCCALSRAQAVLSSLIPFQPRYVFHVRLSANEHLLKSAALKGVAAHAQRPYLPAMAANQGDMASQGGCMLGARHAYSVSCLLPTKHLSIGLMQRLYSGAAGGAWLLVKGLEGLPAGKAAAGRQPRHRGLAPDAAEAPAESPRPMR